MQVSAVKVSLTAAESARMAISTSWSMPNDTSWLRVRCGPVTCARPSAWRTSGAASGGQTVANRCPRTMKCPGRCSRLITASASAASRTRAWCLMNCTYPLAGANSTAPSASARLSSSTAVGPAFGCGSGFPLPCSLIASARSAAMLAITWGSWIETAVWWMK